MACSNAKAKLRESCDAVSLEGGTSGTPKIGRARRNALKAASLVSAFRDQRSALAGIGSPRTDGKHTDLR
jgi:hypothetical protein